MSDVFITHALRTPIGTAGKAFRDVPAADLGAAVLKELLPAGHVEDVVLGNCMGPGGNVARVAALTAGIGDHVPAMTVDRQCASGLAAIQLASGSTLGFVLAGGVESASTAPWRFWPPVGDSEPVRYERAPFAPADRDPEMGAAADTLAELHGITRDRQDEYAARSHGRAAQAQLAGAFDAEIVPVNGQTVDERIRSGLTVQRLAKLPAVFRADGTVTAGNSCGINDGAAVVALSKTGPGLRVLAAASAGVDPMLPGLGIVPAVQKVLKATGLSIEQIDVWEFNEAFAGQVLACCDVLGLPDERVCTQGGALALGHPWGASGAVLAVRLFSQLVTQQSGRYGVAAIAAGGGQGTAILVEACR
ncbi:acetyl-CoA C-acyltransferase [Kribbella albertanoniae]|uniref:Probable acetyl-CoA acetyltransferase n=1 Tax=Kribbella albertanoniae TaxID=1266829 RepID=A0A4V2XQM6_9ACTN|nr:thiolase family protein [Kribbella albertanoniae]TDC26635.1 thiolase family protein [Kribbella albertanoniae]